MASFNDLGPDAYAEIMRRLAKGEIQHIIAADYRINQGRVSELKTGKRDPETGKLRPGGPPDSDLPK